MRRFFSSIQVVRKMLLHGAQPGDFSKDIFIIEGSKETERKALVTSERKMGETLAIIQVAEETGRLMYRIHDSGDRVKFNVVDDFLKKHGIELNLNPIIDDMPGGPPPVHLMIDQGPSRIEVIRD